MLLKSTTYSHDNDVCSTRDTTISTWYPQFRLRLRMFCSDAEITEINQKIIISLQENKRLIWRAAMACSAAITMLFRTRVYQSNVSKIPTVLIFQWTVFNDGGFPGAGPRGTKRKRNSVVGGRAELALGCPLIREPLRDVCRIIVD